MALGKGLGSLIPSKEESPAVHEAQQHVGLDVSGSILEVSPEKIKVNPHQPRKVFQPRELEELINSIKVHGIIQPLIVTAKGDGSYELIAGERRLRSAKTLGMKTVPVIIRDAKEQEKLELAVIENIQRKQLNALEEAVSYERLLHEFNLTQEEVANRVGKSRSTVANLLRIIELPEEVRQAIMDEKITAGHARAIASLESPSQQLQMLTKILTNDINVRDTEREVRNVKGGGQKQQFDPLVVEYEEKLRQKLGAKVTITKSGNKGEIKITYNSLEDFKDITNSLLS